MATWKTYYQAVFASKDGYVYAANLMKLTDTTPTVIYLRPAENPLVTREDADDDVFTPIRSQSGYLRVIDTSGSGLLEGLIPPNNTTLMIRIYRGTYSGTWPNGTFTGDSSRYNIVWAGFVQSQIYTQPWTENTSILELPIVSMLGSLKNVQVDVTALQPKINIVYLARKAAAELSGRSHGYEIWEKFSFITDIANYLTYYYFNVAMLQSKKEYVNDDGVRVTVSEGITYYEALERVVALFGITLRESGYRLYWSKLCASGSHMSEILNYDEDEGDFETATEVTEVDLEDLVNNNGIQFSSTKNTRSLIPGKRNAVIEFGLNTESALNLVLPQTVEDESTVYEYDVIHSGEPSTSTHSFRIQPHAQVSSSAVSYAIRPHGTSDSGAWSDVFEASVFCAVNRFPNPPSWAPATLSNIIWSGAIPVRFAWHESGGSYGNMAQAHLLTLFPCNSDDDATRETSADEKILSINSVNSQELTDGYINIQMHIWPIFADHLYSSAMGVYLANNSVLANNSETIKLKLIVRVGDYYYNGSSWVQDSSARVIISFNPTNIVSNYSSDFNVEDAGGFFIPVPQAITSGIVEVAICDYMGSSDYGNIRDYRTIILDEFLVQHLRSSEVTASSRSTNTYRRVIASVGYSEDKDISLAFGTYNNNLGAINFVEKNSGTRWTDDVPFKIYDSSISTGYSILSRRPEVQLLNAIQDYHKKVRSTYTGWIRKTASTAINWMETLISYNSHYFYGIIKQRNWRDGDEEFKLIETSRPDEDE